MLKVSSQGTGGFVFRGAWDSSLLTQHVQQLLRGMWCQGSRQLVRVAWWSECIALKSSASTCLAWFPIPDRGSVSQDELKDIFISCKSTRVYKLASVLLGFLCTSCIYIIAYGRRSFDHPSIRKVCFAAQSVTATHAVCHFDVISCGDVCSRFVTHDRNVQLP